MTTIRTMAAMPAISTIDRSPAHKGHRNGALLIAAALFLAVLIADAVLIAKAAPSVTEIGWLYMAMT